MGYVLGHTPFHVVLTLGMFVHFLAGAIALETCLPINGNIKALCKTQIWLS